MTPCEVGSCLEYEWRNGLLDFIFPRDCILTGEALESGPLRHLSPQGVLQLERITDPRCATCGHPFFGIVNGPRHCPHCLGLSPAFDKAVCAFRSKDAMRHLIHRMKYRGESFLAEDLAHLALEDDAFRRHLAGSFLVPVPLYPQRQRERGYNQAEILSQELARSAPGCVSLNALIRIRDTSQQVRLGREQRVQNMDDAFRLCIQTPLPTGRFVLIDDVLTTGATLSACAAALRIGGAHLVDAATLAHG